MRVNEKQQETLERFLRKKRPGLPTIFLQVLWMVTDWLLSYHGGISAEGNGGRYVLELPCRIYALYLRHQHVVLPLYDLQGTERFGKIRQRALKIPAGVRTAV